MRVKNCPVYSKNFQKFRSKKKRRDSAPGCRASKLLDFRPLLHLLLEAVSWHAGTCWLFILCMHFHIVTSNFHCFKSGPQKRKKPVISTLFAMSLVPTVGLLQILRIQGYYTLPWVSKHTGIARRNVSSTKLAAIHRLLPASLAQLSYPNIADIHDSFAHADS